MDTSRSIKNEHQSGAAVALAAIALAIAAGPAAAAGVSPWSAPVTISDATFQNSEPGIAFDSSGRGLAWWSSDSCSHPCTPKELRASFGGRASLRALDGRFGAARALPLAPARITLYGRGRAVLFGPPRGVAFGSTSGRFGRPRTIGTGIGTLAVNGRGQMALASVRSPAHDRTVVMLSERRAGGSFGAPRPIAGSQGASNIDVALGARGDLVIAWVRAGRIEARVRPAGGRMGPAVRLGRSSPNGTLVQASVSDRGAIWVLWENRECPEDCGPYTLRLAMRPARAHAFGRAHVLDRHAEHPTADDLAYRFQLDLDAAGAAYVAWSGSDGTRVRAKLATIDPSGRSLRVLTLSQPGYDAAVYDLATSTRPGAALVTWTRLDSDPHEPPDIRIGYSQQVLAGLLEPDRAFAGEEAVSAGDRAGQPVGAFDPLTGAPTIVWSQLLGVEALRLEQRSEVVRASTRAGAMGR